MKRWILRVGAGISLISALALLLYSGLPRPADYTGETLDGIGQVAPEVGAIAPPFDNQTLSGDVLRLQDLRGETVVLNFWATWCAPCAIEMPELQALYEDEGVRVIGVNFGEAEDSVQAWVDTYGLGFDILLDPQQTVTQAYRLRGQPSTYVINPDGIITHIFYGAVQQSALQRAIRTQYKAES